MQFADMTRSYKRMKKDIDRVIASVFSRGVFILGPEVKRFENEFARHVNVPYAVGVNSGTDALVLSLMALGIGKGDEVLTVSHTAAPTISAIMLAGAKPVYVDVLEKDMTMDPSDAAEKITKRTKAIIPVHLYGYPCDMDSISMLARKYNLKVIEDACQAHGAMYDGKSAGTLGDTGCFSFYPTKNLGCYGDGGMVVCKNKRTADSVRAMRQYGWTKDRTGFVSAGMNSRLSEIQAAILRVKLRSLDKDISVRRKLAGIYKKELEKMPLLLPSEVKGRTHAYHLYVIRTRGRDALCKYLSSKNIPTMIHYPYCMHKSEIYGSKKTRLPVTEKIQKEILSLPLYGEMRADEVRTVAAGIKLFFK